MVKEEILKYPYSVEIILRDVAVKARATTSCREREFSLHSIRYLHIAKPLVPFHYATLFSSSSFYHHSLCILIRFIIYFVRSPTMDAGSGWLTSHCSFLALFFLLLLLLSSSVVMYKVQIQIRIVPA